MNPYYYAAFIVAGHLVTTRAFSCLLHAKRAAREIALTGIETHVFSAKQNTSAEPHVHTKLHTFDGCSRATINAIDAVYPEYDQD